MARAAVIPGVSDAPPPRTTRGRGQTPAIATTTTTDTEDVSSKLTDQQPAKRGRKPGKTTAGTTSSASAKTAVTKTSEKKKKTTTTTTTSKSRTVNEEDDLGLEVVTTTSKRGGGSKAAASKKSNNARASKKGHANTTTGKYKEQEEDVDRDGNSDEDDDDDDELADFEVMTKKSTQSLKTKTSTASVPTKSTRGRRPKATNTIDESARDVVEVTDKKTKGRRAAAQSTVGESKSKILYITPASMTSSLAKHQIAGEPSRKKKQVTFADLADSENEQSANEEEEEEGEEEEEQPAKSTAKTTKTKSSKSTGLKANPVRKAGTATRGRPPKSRTTAAVKPLSPKKPAQLAKGSTTTSASSGDEDELASKNSKPIYSLVVQKSPSKTAAEPQHTGLNSPVKKVLLPGQTATPVRSPVRPARRQDENLIPDARDLQLSSTLRDTTLIGTPARRPPSSTSKETIRDTPRRGPLFINSATVSKFADNTATSSFMQTLSPLKSSPKKAANFGDSFLSAASDKEISTPFNAKSSLLKSPAKRIQSPFIFQKVIANRDDARAETQTAVSEDVDSEMLDDGDSVVGDDIVDSEHQGNENEITMDEQAAELADDEDDDVFVDHAITEACDSRPDNDEMPKEDHLSTDSADSMHDTDLADGSQAIVEEQQDDYVEKDVEMTQNGYDDAEHEVDDRQDLVQSREIVDIAEPEFQSGNDMETRDETNEGNELERIQETNEHTDPSRSSSDHMEQEPYSEQVDIEEDNNQKPLETESTTSPTAIYVESTEKKEIHDAGNHTPRSQYSTRSSTAGDVIYPDEIDELSSERAAETPRSVPPAVPTPPSFSVRHHFRASYRDQHIDDLNSEYGSSPASRRQSTFSSRDSILPHGPDDTFTSLATHLSSWKASSPEKRRNKAHASSIFSPVVPEKLATPRQSTRADKFSQIQSLRQSLAARHSMAKTIILDGDEPDTVERQDIKDNVHKGTEMAVQPQLPFSMSLTPVRLNRGEIRTVHTVSKVPLKPEAEESPLKNRRKRAHSMSMNIQLPIRASPGRVKLVPKSRKSLSASPLPSSSISTSSGVESSQEQKVHEPMPVSAAQNSPMKTPRRDAKTDKQCLRGAVVLVDVHTTEGEDASGIFVELLTQMGAKCVKSWSWNPRSSQSPGVDGLETINTSKVGITHVVYKDGGVRTMEKVRQAGDLVKCVGVGWVLDCERANKWIDEAHYYVDSTIIPRGGAKRRKSMQPRALANVNGTIFSPSSSSSSLSSSNGFNNSIGFTRPSKTAAEMEETMEDFKRMSPSSSVSSINNSTRTPTTPPRQDADQSDSKTVRDSASSEYQFNFNFDFTAMSPATPGFLTQPSRLTQQTCPPKQTNQGLFSSLLSGDSDGAYSGYDNTPSALSKSGAGLRLKLEAARRKSLAFKPRLGSPLSRS